MTDRKKNLEKLYKMFSVTILQLFVGVHFPASYILRVSTDSTS